MRILVLNRYDPLHPKAGGAERFTGEIMARFVENGHSVTWFASGKALKQPEHRGMKIVRKGNKLSVLLHAYFYFRKQGNNFDLVIDEIHALPFLTPLYVPAQKRVSLIHEVAGRIWFYMLPVQLALFGYILEKLLLRLYYRKEHFFTVSKATRKELISLGIAKEKITIIPEGISPVAGEIPAKTATPSIVYFGGLRPLKRVEHQLQAVSLLKKEYPYLRFHILGRTQGRYYEKLRRIISRLQLDEIVQFTGFLSETEKNNLVASSWLTLGTSVKEGWGLAVAEAALLGTPAVVYPTPGNTEAVLHLKTGLHTVGQTPQKLAQAIRRLFTDPALREKMGKAAQESAKTLTWENSYRKFAASLP